MKTSWRAIWITYTIIASIFVVFLLLIAFDDKYEKDRLVGIIAFEVLSKEAAIRKLEGLEQDHAQQLNEKQNIIDDLKRKLEEMERKLEQ